MKFEHINNQLCLMTEPVPLTEDAKFPCVVRLIQDDSPMGRYNQWNWQGLTELTHMRELLGLPYDNMIPCIEAEDEDHISHYEILGYPVADGSAEWAAWRMMQGDKVSDCLTIHYYELHDSIILRHIIGSNSTHSPRSIDEWIKAIGTGKFSNTGWQIYAEPKPLLADAQVGDLVKLRNGEYAQIIKTSETTPPTHPYLFFAKNGTHVATIHGMVSCDCTTHMEYDIISTEPLAPEGSAEWAWQMWCLLGKEITHPKIEKLTVFTCNEAETVLFGYIASYWQEEKADWLNTCNGHNMLTGWQLYEPKPDQFREATKKVEPCPTCNGTGVKPAPAFEVGALVQRLKFDNAIYRFLGNVEGYKNLVRLQNIVTKTIFSCGADTIDNHISPSEVEISIGCLEGTVSKCDDVGMEITHFYLHIPGTEDDKDADTWCLIALAMLDTPTADLVRELLKAQEEK